MKKRKFLAGILALTMALSLTACGGGGGDDQNNQDDQNNRQDENQNQDQEQNTGNTAGDARVAMITDYGDITDESFNQTTYEACKAYCEAGNLQFNYFRPDGDSTGDRVAMIEKAIDEDYNILVMPGFAFAGAVLQTASQNPDIKFIVLDVAKTDYLSEAVPAKGEVYDNNPDNWVLEDYADLSNVYTMIYQEELCGYMAGYAAVKLGYTHLGFLGGMAVPAVQRFGYGYIQGADAAAGETGSSVTMEYVYGNKFNGTPDITAYMDNWYQTLGVQVVFACGGSIYTSAAEAAAKVDDAKIIGVDVDQSSIINTYKDGLTLTSAMKGLASSTHDALDKAIQQDQWASMAGKIDNLGLVSGDDPTANYVQLPLDTTQWGDAFTQDDYKALVKGMFDGTIQVSNDTTAMPTVSNITVNDAGSIQ